MANTLVSFDVGKFNDKSETAVLFGVRKVCFAVFGSVFCWPRTSCQPTGTGVMSPHSDPHSLQEQREFDFVLSVS